MIDNDIVDELIAYLGSKGIEAKRVKADTVDETGYDYYEAERPHTSTGISPTTRKVWPEPGVWARVEWLLDNNHLADFKEPKADKPKPPVKVTK